MAELHINYSQTGSPYMIEFQQNGAVVKTIVVPVSPDGSPQFSDSIPDGVYDVNSFNLSKTPCVLVTGFFWYNPNKGFASEQRAKGRGVFNGRKLLQKGVPFENNAYLTYGGNGYGGKNPVSFKVQMYKGLKGFFKVSAGGVLAKSPTLKVDASVPVALD